MKKQNGQTLLEILLAFSVSILVLSVIVVSIITSLGNTQYTKNQNLANSYAKEGMDVVRGIRDSNWLNFYSKNSTNYCLRKSATMLDDYDGKNCVQNGRVETFVRRVKLIHDSPDCSAGIPPTPTPTPTIVPRGSRVTVIVSWSDNKCPVGNPFCHKVELISCLSNLDQKQAP